MQETHREQFEVPEVGVTLETRHFFPDELCPVFARPSPRVALAAGEKRFREPAESQEGIEFVRALETKLRHGKGMEAMEEEAPLEGVSAVAVPVEPRASRNQDGRAIALFVEQALEPVPQEWYLWISSRIRRSDGGSRRSRMASRSSGISQFR